MAKYLNEIKIVYNEEFKSKEVNKMKKKDKVKFKFHDKDLQKIFEVNNFKKEKEM